jgi:hypothetical protein
MSSSILRAAAFLASSFAAESESSSSCRCTSHCSALSASSLTLALARSSASCFACASTCSFACCSSALFKSFVCFIAKAFRCACPSDEDDDLRALPGSSSSDFIPFKDARLGRGAEPGATNFGAPPAVEAGGGRPGGTPCGESGRESRSMPLFVKLNRRPLYNPPFSFSRCEFSLSFRASSGSNDSRLTDGSFGSPKGDRGDRGDRGGRGSPPWVLGLGEVLRGVTWFINASLSMWLPIAASALVICRLNCLFLLRSTA